jgi:PAS domain S-box-containing protein
MLDRQGQVLAVNNRACRHYGYPREAFLTRHINDIRTPEEAVDAPGRFALVDQQGEAVYETLHRDAGGCVIPVEVRATRIMLDGQPAILCLCLDITERQQAEETIKRSRADLERAQAIAHVGSWSMDLVTNQIEWSKENYRIFGIERGTPISYDAFFS